MFPSSYQMRFGSMKQSMIGYGGGRIGVGVGGAAFGPGYQTGYQTGYKYYGYEGGANFSRLASIEEGLSNVSVDGLSVSTDLITTREEEKAVLGSLNDRFVTYIEKVHFLVNKNKALEAKIKQLEELQNGSRPSSSLYEAHLHKLQKEIERIIYEKTQVELRLENIFRELEEYKKKWKREFEDRQEAEDKANHLTKDIDQATLIRVELENKIESLRGELELMTANSKDEIQMLTQQMINMQACPIMVDGPEQTDLLDALREIRAAYEQFTLNNKIEIESFLKKKINDLTSQLKEETTINKNQQNELIETRRQLHTVTVELEGLRTSFATLESQLAETEDRYQNEISKYQLTISEMEKELDTTRDKYKTQLVAYNELLNIKLSLDLEIQTYKKLLEGEESRITFIGYGSESVGGVTISGEKVSSGFASNYGDSVTVSGGKISSSSFSGIGGKNMVGGKISYSFESQYGGGMTTSNNEKDQDLKIKSRIAHVKLSKDKNQKEIGSTEGLDSDSESEI